MTAELTIAIPFYSGLEYLGLAIESVLAQSDPDWRLLVVDDSPAPGGMGEFLARFRDERIGYLANPGNLGMVRCWNRCLDEARTDLVCLLHADDRLLPNYVSLVRRLAREHPSAVAVFPDSLVIDAAGREGAALQDGIKRLFVPRGRGDVVLSGEPGLRAILRGNFIFCPSITWRRSVLGARRFEPEWRQVQDLELTSRLLLEDETLVGAREKAYAYRRHAANATARQTESLLRFEEEFELFERIADRAQARGWGGAARTSRGKLIVRLHLAWRVLAELGAGRPRAALRILGFATGLGSSAAPGSELDRLVGDTGGVLVTSLTGLGLAFATNLVLAHALGAEAYGALTYTLVWAEVLSMLAPLGFDKLLIPELARLRYESSWALARGLLACAGRWTIAGLIAASAVIAGFGLLGRLDPALVPVFWLALVLVPLRAAANLCHGALLGLSRPVAGTMAASVTWTVVLLPLAGLLWLVFPHGFSATTAAWAAAGAWALTALVAWLQMRATLEREGARVPAARGDERAWLSAAGPMFLIVAMALVSLRADVLMLGAMVGAREAGIYATAASFAFLVRMGLVAVRPVLAPLAVRAQSALELERVSRRAARLAFVPAAGVALLLLVAGRWMLGLYSSEFVEGSTALVILTIGFLVAAALGPVDTVLLMRNQQRLAAVSAVVACVLNLALNAVLIPTLGMEGAALGTVVSLVAWSLGMGRAIRRRLGFGMSIFGRTR